MADVKLEFDGAPPPRAALPAQDQVAGGRRACPSSARAKHIYAQVIDDKAGPHPGRRVVAREGDARRAEDRRRPRRGDEVGKLLAERAIAAG
jgi:hypothetical protein